MSTQINRCLTAPGCHLRCSGNPLQIHMLWLFGRRICCGSVRTQLGIFCCSFQSLWEDICDLLMFSCGSLVLPSCVFWTSLVDVLLVCLGSHESFGEGRFVENLLWFF